MLSHSCKFLIKCSDKAERNSVQRQTEASPEELAFNETSTGLSAVKCLTEIYLPAREKLAIRHPSRHEDAKHCHTLPIRHDNSTDSQH